ncbi:MAG: hypothetical protein AB8E82_15920 [Aureispira sp.]
MQHVKSWTLIVIAIISFTFLPAQAAIIYGDPPPAKKKKKSKKAIQKAPSIFSFFKQKKTHRAAPNQLEKEQGTYAIEFSIIAFIFFFLALLASIWVLFVLTIPVFAGILIAINTLGMMFASYGFFPHLGAGLSIIYTPIAILATLILIGLAFSIPWLWISMTIVAAVLAAFFLVVLVLYLNAMSAPPYRPIHEKEEG